MTLLGWPALLGAIVIDSTNKTIRVIENGVTEDLNLVEGTYYLRGDGASGDFCPALETCLATHTGGNTYSVLLELDPDDAQRTARVTITRSGANAFSILFNHANTTFDEALIGYADAATASGSSCTGTLSPTATWVGDEVIAAFDPFHTRSAYAKRAKSGIVRGGTRSNKLSGMRLSFAMLGEKRVNVRAITSDPDRALESFVDYVADGRPLEFHVCDLSAGRTTSPLSSSTEQGDRWHLAEESAQEFNPQRLEEGVALYDVDLTLWAYAE